MTLIKKLLILHICVFFSITVYSQTGRWGKVISDNNWSLWLDKSAIWYNDKIYLPPVDISTLPVNLPSGGWEKLRTNNLNSVVSVPGTVEEHYWGRIGGAIPDTNGNYVGVSWWSKKFRIEKELKGKRISLAFQSVNLRAEIFVNEKLVGYDVIGNTPFEVDITDAVLFEEDNQLDVRITDPVGNFSWNDNILMRWGKNLVPAVHGFGGITGSVILRATDRVCVEDIYVQNQPDPRKVHIFITLNNYSGALQKGELSVTLHEKGNMNAILWNKSIPASVSGSSEVFSFFPSVPKAKLWELSVNNENRSAKLYEATVSFSSENKRIVDTSSRRFGFRWFDVGVKDGDKRFYLNGKRVVILSAMSRGFWPENGIFPTQEMVMRDMNSMLDLGLNTMKMHRAIGQPEVFKYADSVGLLTFEEPGGFRIAANRLENIDGPDDQAFNWRREKLRRMAIRDRSCPSLFMYNMKNEETIPPSEKDIQDMLMLQSLDPSRIITYNSGNDVGKTGPEYYKYRSDDTMEMHILPFNNKIQYGGWWDQHHWYQYSGYTDDWYRNPKFYARGVINAPRLPIESDSLHPMSVNKSKIIFFGEEGGVGTMVRLQKIKEELEHTGATGFRELEHIDWFEYYDRFLDESGFRKAFPNVDSLTMSLGRKLHYFHGRTIENVRMSNIADAYVMNGWASESTRTDIVDMYRNPTADPSIIRHYTQALYIAVKLRNKVVPVGSECIADFYIINENFFKGKHILLINFSDDKGNSLFKKSFSVNVKGGEDFGQLLFENVKLPPVKLPGYYRLEAYIDGSKGKSIKGFDDLYAVDIYADTISASCSILEEDNTIKSFLSKIAVGLGMNVYSEDSPETDIIVIGNHDFNHISKATLQDIFERVKNGSKLIVLSNSDRFALEINNFLMNRPAIYQGGGIIQWGHRGKPFVGFNTLLTGLPQGQSMNWEYQCFYTGTKMGDPSPVAGIRLDNWGSDMVVALGNQGSKEILSCLSRIPVGQGTIILSTLNIPANLTNENPCSVVGKKLFLNLLKY